MTIDEYWFWLCNLEGIYQPDIDKLIKIFESPKVIFSLGEEYIIKSGLEKEKIESILRERNSLSIFHKFEKMNKDGINFIHMEHMDYPKCFNCLNDKPYSLYVKGKLPNPNFKACAMVGARSCSDYGREQAFKFSKILAKNKVQIISGMALGIDSISSMGALSAGGRTFVVLGSGIDVIYPADNIELYYEIIMNGGGVISEYPIGTKPLAWQFPHRNRLISAFSQVVLVLEARKRSGTLVTARYAIEQGKDVFVLPGRITDKLSEGCNELISDGAGILLNTQTVLDALLIEEKDIPSEFCETDVSIDGDDQMINIYKLICTDDGSIQNIIKKTGLSATDVAQRVAELEIMGMIKEVGVDCYSKAIY